MRILVTGCFDVLHPAHIRFLKAAKKQGQVLFVGIEPDKRVKKLKGKGRPVNKEAVRMANLKKLKIADFVFVLPLGLDQLRGQIKLLKKIKPDILAVSDSTPHLKEKIKLMRKINGRVKIVASHDKRFSTTKLLTSAPKSF